MEEDLVVQPKPDDFMWDRQYWLSNVWDAETASAYIIEKTKNSMGIL